ncbi:MAG: hypothetical protein ABIP29_05390 [Candidatus Eisenbacteria bacterium]
MQRLAALVLLVALGGLAPAACAQSIWLDRVSPRTIHLEGAKPFLEGDRDGFFTTTWFLSTRLPLGERLAFVGELPFATAKTAFDLPTFGLFEASSSAIGNPYLGIETRPASGRGSRFELGVRLPAASDNEFATATGAATDVDRWEAFFPDIIVLRSTFHWRDDVVGKPGIDVRLGPALWLADGLGGNAEIFAHYGLQFLYHGTEARAGAGIGGRWLLTGGGDLGASSVHQVEAAADFLPGRVRPGVTLRIPLEDNGIDLALGLTLNVVLQ